MVKLVEKFTCQQATSVPLRGEGEFLYNTKKELQDTGKICLNRKSSMLNIVRVNKVLL